MYRNNYDQATADMYKYLQANNNAGNASDKYGYTPSRKDIDSLSQGGALDNIRSYNGDKVQRYKGVIGNTDAEHDSYLYQLYKNSLR